MTNKNKIKPVLFISDNFPPVIGGSSTVYDQICKNNADIVVALSSKENTQGEIKTGINNYDDSCGYKMYRTNRLRVAQKKASKSSKIQSMLTEFMLIIRLIPIITKICFQHKVKVVCVGELIYGGWIVLFSRYILRKKTILYTHGEEISQVADGFYNKYRGVFLRSAHKIIAVSLFCKSQIVSLYNITPDKIDIISNGVDTNRFKTGLRNNDLLLKHNIKNTDKVILTVGRLVERKGHHNLILAMDEIIKSKPNAKLIIIGSGPEEKSLLALTNKLRLNSCITFLNNINDEELIQYYQSADIFTMPNITLKDGDTEGFGLVFLEANACSKPVVGGQAGGAIEAIIHNETGLLVNGYNVDEIANSILRIINDDSLHKTLTKHAYEFAQISTWKTKALLFGDLVLQIQSPIINNTLHFDHHKAINNKKEKRLHITIDFEEMFDWCDLTNSNVSVQGIDEIEQFHQRCVNNNIQVTYLVTYNVLQSNEAVHFLKSIDTNNHEIGIHLHPWNSPPFIERINTFNSFQCNLPHYLEQLKIDEIITLFTKKMGFSPKLHRAGRYGCSQRTLNYLQSKNIQIDLSPSAGYNFNEQGGPNFALMDNSSFWSDKKQQLLCIPVPSIQFLKGPDALTKLVNKNTSIAQLIKKGLQTILPSTPVRLSPEANSLDRMKLIGSLLNQQEIQDFVLSVHSTSLYAGGNKYSSTKEAAQENIDKIIEYAKWSHEHLKTHSATPTTLK